MSAIHKAEGGRCAKDCKSSPVGAKGPMQFMPLTWNAYKCEGLNNISKLDDSICAGTRYLSALYEKEKKQAPHVGNRWHYWKAACRYNSGYKYNCTHADTPQGIQGYANKVIAEMGFNIN